MKSREDVLNQDYMSAKDLKILIPKLGLERCKKYIKSVQEEMKLKNYFVPETKECLALTKLVRKKFGF